MKEACRRLNRCAKCRLVDKAHRHGRAPVRCSFGRRRPDRPELVSGQRLKSHHLRHISDKIIG